MPTLFPQIQASPVNVYAIPIPTDAEIALGISQSFYQYTDNHNLQRGYSTEYSSKIQIHRLIVLTSLVHSWQAYTTLTHPISAFFQC